MNVEMIRQNYGKKQITIHAMKWNEFVSFLAALDAIRYPEQREEK